MTKAELAKVACNIWDKGELLSESSYWSDWLKLTHSDRIEIINDYFFEDDSQNWEYRTKGEM